MREGQVWTEYRSAVLYRNRDRSVDIRETHMTRRTISEARLDARNGLPHVTRRPDEPEVFRAIVSRRRVDPSDWQIETDETSFTDQEEEATWIFKSEN